jgi:hypothetical protein
MVGIQVQHFYGSIMKLPAAHAAQAPALRELQGILAKANKI